MPSQTGKVIPEIMFLEDQSQPSVSVSPRRSDGHFDGIFHADGDDAEALQVLDQQVLPGAVRLWRSYRLGPGRRDGRRLENEGSQR